MVPREANLDLLSKHSSLDPSSSTSPLEKDDRILPEACSSLRHRRQEQKDKPRRTTNPIPLSTVASKKLPQSPSYSNLLQQQRQWLISTLSACGMWLEESWSTVWWHYTRGNIHWITTVFMFLAHAGALAGLWQAFNGRCHKETLVLSFYSGLVRYVSSLFVLYE